MANYYATTRSNYFKVKDADSFRDFCSSLALESWDGNDDTVAISADTGDCGGWPSYDHEKDEDLDFPVALSEHLATDEVAILFESGAEKRRYIVGLATAVNDKGECLSVSLHDIYEMAAQLSDKPISPAEY